MGGKTETGLGPGGAALSKNKAEGAGGQPAPRGRGRPRLANPKESINIRLDQDILTTLREIGPGWQSKVNEILREALKL